MSVEAPISLTVEVITTRGAHVETLPADLVRKFCFQKSRDGLCNTPRSVMARRRLSCQEALGGPLCRPCVKVEPDQTLQQLATQKP